MHNEQAGVVFNSIAEVDVIRESVGGYVLRQRDVVLDYIRINTENSSRAESGRPPREVPTVGQTLLAALAIQRRIEEGPPDALPVGDDELPAVKAMLGQYRRATRRSAGNAPHGSDDRFKMAVALERQVTRRVTRSQSKRSK